jgi:hypothetical protein
MSCPAPQNCCSTSLFATVYNKLTEGGQGSCVFPSQLSALRTLYIGFKKSMLKKTWDSENLRTKTLRVRLMLFLDFCTGT